MSEARDYVTSISRDGNASNVSQAAMMNIKVRSLNGPDIDLQILPEITVLQLKDTLFTRTSTPVTLQRLIYRGRVLEDANQLLSYNLEDGHTLHMVRRSAPPAPVNDNRSERPPYSSISLSSFNRQRASQESDIEGSTRRVVNRPSRDILRNWASADTSEIFAALINEAQNEEAGVARDGHANSNPPRPIRSVRRQQQVESGQSSTLEHVRQGLLTLHTLTAGLDLNRFMAPRYIHRPGLRNSLSASDHRPSTEGRFNSFRERMNHLINTRDSIFESSRSDSLVSPDLASDESRGGFYSGTYSPSRPSSRNSSQSRMFYRGQWVDCKDTVGNWLEATVMDVRYNAHEVLIHYNGWPERWDEWINRDSPRLAPFCTRTSTSASGSFLSPSPRFGVEDSPNTGNDDVRLIIPEVVSAMDTVDSLLRRLSLYISVGTQPAFPSYPGSLPWNPEAHFDSSRGAVQHARIRELARDAAPIVDRFGRLLADLAPFLADLGRGEGDNSGVRRRERNPDNNTERSPSPGLRRLVSVNSPTARTTNSGQIEIHVHAVTVSATPPLASFRRARSVGTNALAEITPSRPVPTSASVPTADDQNSFEPPPMNLGTPSGTGSAPAPEIFSPRYAISPRLVGRSSAPTSSDSPRVVGRPETDELTPLLGRSALPQQDVTAVRTARGIDIELVTNSSAPNPENVTRTLRDIRNQLESVRTGLQQFPSGISDFDFSENESSTQRSIGRDERADSDIIVQYLRDSLNERETRTSEDHNTEHDNLMSQFHNRHRDLESRVRALELFTGSSDLNNVDSEDNSILSNDISAGRQIGSTMVEPETQNIDDISLLSSEVMSSPVSQTDVRLAEIESRLRSLLAARDSVLMLQAREDISRTNIDPIPANQVTGRVDSDSILSSAAISSSRRATGSSRWEVESQLSSNLSGLGLSSRSFGIDSGNISPYAANFSASSPSDEVNSTEERHSFNLSVTSPSSVEERGRQDRGVFSSFFRSMSGRRNNS